MNRMTSGTWAPLPGPKNQKWEQAVRGKDLDHPIEYDINRKYVVGQIVRHAKFGLGVVMGIKEGDKIYVVFRDDTRILIHGQKKDRR